MITFKRNTQERLILPSQITATGGSIPIMTYNMLPRQTRQSTLETQLSNYEGENAINSFYIISKKVTKNMYNGYMACLKEIGKVSFISDQPSLFKINNIYHYPNQLMNKEGFYGTHGVIKTSAWDKVFWHLKIHPPTTNYIWIIEDDCYLNQTEFPTLIQALNQEKTDLIVFGWHKMFKKVQDRSWANWRWNNKSGNQRYFDQIHLQSSINQLVRLSTRTVSEIIKFQIEHQHLIPHEILLASIVATRGFTMSLKSDSKIRLNALKPNSLFETVKRKYGINNQDALKKLKEEKIIATHPIKNWYDLK